MRDSNNRGFSLVEILVSLFVVSLAAVNISGLQKMVGEQNRDNVAHAAVVKLSTLKLEDILKLESIAAVDNLDETSETQTVGHTTFELTWAIQAVTGAGSDIRNVQLNISWPDATGAIQTFTHSEQISLAMLLSGAGGGSGTPFSYTIPSLLNTTKVNYFEPKMGYKNDAYVIYNSQLFHATSVHSVGGGHQRDTPPPISTDGTVASGWENLGQIDNPALAELFVD